MREKRMNRSGVMRLAALTITVCAGLASTAFGDTPTVEFGIYSANTSQYLAGVYTDPYIGYYNNNTALGNGTGYNSAIFSSANATQVAAFCDDFTNDVTPPQYWVAYDTSLTALTSTSPVYYQGTSGSSYATSTWDPAIQENNAMGTLVGGSSSSLSSSTFSQIADYIAVAYLAYESQQAMGGSNCQACAQAQERYSYGLWGVFDPSLLYSATTIYGSMSSDDLAQARLDLVQALGVGEYYAGLGTNGTTQFVDDLQIDVHVYTPVSGAPGSYGPQEFVVVTPTPGQGVQAPEASSWASMGLDLSGLALLALVFRRRLGRQQAI
ncbi:MAG TPA: hypothetical protein VG897_00295 [Terriglobales bacterium]|nr:hypothetical protein [Terriglobales bacterium]